MNLPAPGVHPFQMLMRFGDPLNLSELTRDFISAGTRYRSDHIETIVFYLLSRETLVALVERLRGKRVLEVFSGSGSLAQQLAHAGVDVTACDNNETGYAGLPKGWDRPFKRDLVADATTLDLAPYDVVIMCWPDYKHDASERVARNLRPGQTLIYQGEGRGGCTGNDGFFKLLENEFDELPSEDLNEHHPRFWGIHDSWQVFQLKERT